MRRSELGCFFERNRKTRKQMASMKLEAMSAALIRCDDGDRDAGYVLSEIAVVLGELVRWWQSGS